MLTGNVIPSIRGKSQISCQLLTPDGNYAGFNGNKKRKGLGYYLMSPGGWMTKAGYENGAIQSFFEDLNAISGPLGLVPVGTHTKDNDFLDITRMKALSATNAGRPCSNT